MKFFRSKKKPSESAEIGLDPVTNESPQASGTGGCSDSVSNADQVEEEQKTGLFQRLAKTRKSLSNGLAGLFQASKEVDEDWFEEIEDQLILSDMGASTSARIVNRLREEAARKKYRTADQLLDNLRTSMVEILEGPSQRPWLGDEKPYVILMVGVNGVGKTTTLAKIASMYQNSGKKVLMAACDTFRAAAIEQLQSWGERLSIPVIAQSHGADAAAVAFDAYSAACSRGVDVLVIDTAGRQHTHGDLMEQLKKVKRVLNKANEAIPHEVLLTVDAGNGQNINMQVESFNDVVGVTGLCVTKLDGTAKGGVVVSIVEKFAIPVVYIGVGEQVSDLKPFDARSFVDALIPSLTHAE